MLKELGVNGVSKILPVDNSGSMDSKTVAATLQKHMQRSKAVNVLEGRDRYFAGRKKKMKTGLMMMIRTLPMEDSKPKR